jgi:hypothetical protein
MAQNTYSQEELEAMRERMKKYAEDTKIKIEESDPPMTAGEKMAAFLYQDAKQNATDALANGYLRCPPHLFYTDKEGCRIRRVYGMAVTTDGEIRAHAVTAMIMFNNDVVGGVPLDDLVPIKEWSKEQLGRLQSGLIKCPEAFLKMQGFMLFLPNELPE